MAPTAWPATRCWRAWCPGGGWAPAWPRPLHHLCALAPRGACCVDRGWMRPGWRTCAACSRKREDRCARPRHWRLPWPRRVPWPAQDGRRSLPSGSWKRPGGAPAVSGPIGCMSRWRSPGHEKPGSRGAAGSGVGCRAGRGARGARVPLPEPYLRLLPAALVAPWTASWTLAVAASAWPFAICAMASLVATVWPKTSWPALTERSTVSRATCTPFGHTAFRPSKSRTSASSPQKAKAALVFSSMVDSCRPKAFSALARARRLTWAAVSANWRAAAVNCSLVFWYMAGFLLMSGRDCRFVRCSIARLMLRCNNRSSGRSDWTSSPVAASRCAGLMHHHFRQQRQCRLQPVPDPHRQSLAGGILQALDVIQVMMVQLLVQRLERGLDVGEVHDPARVRAGFARDAQLDPERMTVQARALDRKSVV